MDLKIILAAISIFLSGIAIGMSVTNLIYQFAYKDGLPKKRNNPRDSTSKSRGEDEWAAIEKPSCSVRTAPRDGQAKIITVIVTKSLRGAGTEEDPCREVLQYWKIDGKLIGEEDPAN